MEQTMSRILIETVVKATLKDLKEDPERSIRKLVDMALHFSGNQFQQDFFRVAQTMLKNEDSPYYALARDLISYADADRLLQFGMALGYNSCTCGARQIRESEQHLGHNIPWTILFQLDQGAPERLAQYDAAISQGEGLGVYTWMLFAPEAPENTLDLVRDHPDSAFFLFCAPGALSPRLVDGVSDLKNLMPVLRYQEEHAEEYPRLRALGIPYCVYCPYGPDDAAAIRGGDLFVAAQQTGAVFTVLVPRPDCPEEARLQVRQAVERARNEQLYQTIPWELEGDDRRIDRIISGDACTVCFDPSGYLLDRAGSSVRPDLCLFEQGLTEVLRRACPKETPEVNAP